MMSGEKMITAVINDKFLVTKLSIDDGNEWCPGTPHPVVHKGTRVTFTIHLRKADALNRPSVQVLYTDGPQEAIKFKFSVNVVGDSDEQPFGRVTRSSVSGMEFARGNLGIVSVPLPPDVLAASSVLYVLVALRISESAFEDPEIKYEVSIVDPAFGPLYREINTPIDTNPLVNFDRFDFTSSDYHHFYVHKQVLSLSSDVFRQMFDADKPEDSQFKYIKEGFMELKNLDGAALKEIFTFVYLGHTTRDFQKSVLKVIEGADMYGLQELTIFCERELIALTKNSQNCSFLMECLNVGQNLELPAIVQTCLKNLVRIVKGRVMGTYWLLSMIKLAAKHKHHELVEISENKIVQRLSLNNSLPAGKVVEIFSVAREHDLKNLMDGCASWFSRNLDTLNNNGELDALTEEKTNGMLPLLLDHALSLDSNK